jgi:hypothetical protein
MGMAIRGAKILSESLLDFFKGSLGSRKELEDLYRKNWKHAFQTRLIAGQLLTRLFRKEHLATWSIKVLKGFPGLVPKVIKLTHGKLMDGI